MKILLKWLRLNLLKEMFRFLILEKILRPKYCLTMASIIVNESDDVFLLGITINRHLIFKTQSEFMSADKL